MDSQNPFAFLGEEEDTDILIQNAKTSAAAAALAAKEAALEERKEKKYETKNEHFSMRAKRIILPRYVTKRDIIVRKEKPEGEGFANGGSYNGHVNNNFIRNNNRAEGSFFRNKNNVDSSNGHSNGYHHGGYSNGGYQGKYRRGFDGSANNGGQRQNQAFSGKNGNVSNQKLENVEQVSNAVEKNEEEDGWTKVEKKRSKGKRTASYQSSQVSTVSEKDTTLEDVQEVSNAENNACEKDTTCEDVQEVNNASEEELGGEVQQDINAENNVAEAEAVNGENKSNETERQHKSNADGERPRTKKNGSQKRKNRKNKDNEEAQIVSQKKEEQVTHSPQKMTLEEYVKSLVEKRKALESLKKTENSRVIQSKDFESMVPIGKKTDDALSTNQNTKDSHMKKKDGHKEEEKSHKVTVELQKWVHKVSQRPREPYNGWRRGGESGKEPVKGIGAAAESEKQKQQQPGKGGHLQITEANKLSGLEKGDRHKNGDAALEPLPPVFGCFKQFPNLGGKAA